MGRGRRQEWGRGQRKRSAEPAVSCGINSQLLIQLAPRRVCFCFLSFPLKKINKLFTMSLIEAKSELFISLLWGLAFSTFSSKAKVGLMRHALGIRQRAETTGE